MRASHPLSGQTLRFAWTRAEARAWALALVLVMPGAAAGAPQSPREATPAQPAPATVGATLKICLRLSDNTPFSGLANLNVTTPQGGQMAGTPAEADGETVFSNVPAGQYVAEATAPGFLGVRQTIAVEAGKRIQTVFMIMKPEVVVDATSTGAAGAPGANAAPSGLFWIPPDVDTVVPEVAPNVSCSLPRVLKGASQRMKQFVDDLEKFSATEQVEHYRVDAAGARQTAEVRTFEYVVSVSHNSTGLFQLDEYRNGSVDQEQFPARIATVGLPAMALIFHPMISPDFSFTCEGLGQWAGRPAWQIHYSQRPEMRSRVRAYVIGGKHYPLPLKGRAWVDAGTYEVLRLESDLIHPIEEIGLTREHFEIDYAAVQFHAHKEQLWLPQSADLYVERYRRRYYRRHTFSNFQIFTVDTEQKIHAPKESYCFTNTSDRDIDGILTVAPVSGITIGFVSIRFTIPAGNSTCKSVGPGKDVGMPVESVGSATFVHNGPAGSVKADAYLVKESTLDVIPESTLPQRP